VCISKQVKSNQAVLVLISSLEPHGCIRNLQVTLWKPCCYKSWTRLISCLRSNWHANTCSWFSSCISTNYPLSNNPNHQAHGLYHYSNEGSVGLNMNKIFRNKLYFYRATTLFQQAVIQHLYICLNKEKIKTVFASLLNLGRIA
jgi:hypothetical protein